MEIDATTQDRNFTQRRADDDRATLSSALVEAGRGNRAAFETVYRRTSAKLFGICLRIFPERQDAEDALQDAYISIWNKAATYDASRSSPITWLAIITRNRAIDRLRARGKTNVVDMAEARDVADPTPRADAELLATGERQVLTGCIETLEARDADFIRSAFLRGATYADLADRDALPLGTIKSRIRRALIKLRACLDGGSGA
jgi:RNA polymerase sigma-70 factor, ECF subfamily